MVKMMLFSKTDGHDLSWWCFSKMMLMFYAILFIVWVSTIFNWNVAYPYLSHLSTCTLEEASISSKARDVTSQLASIYPVSYIHYHPLFLSAPKNWFNCPKHVVHVHVSEIFSKSFQWFFGEPTLTTEKSHQTPFHPCWVRLNPITSKKKKLIFFPEIVGFREIPLPTNHQFAGDQTNQPWRGLFGTVETAPRCWNLCPSKAISKSSKVEFPTFQPKRDDGAPKEWGLAWHSHTHMVA